MNFTRLLQEPAPRRRPPSHLRKSTRSPAAPVDLPTPPVPSPWSRHAACRCLTSIPPRSTERLTWATDPVGPCSRPAQKLLLRRVGQPYAKPSGCAAKLAL